jgi:uncharacterized OsmC-like protein
MAREDVRHYEVRARSTETFGRVLCSCRHHHFVADGPVENRCPGEAITPIELSLAGIASCGVELLQVLARKQRFPLEAVSVDVSGTLDLGNPVHPEFALLNAVRLSFRLEGVTDEQADRLVADFKRR